MRKSVCPAGRATAEMGSTGLHRRLGRYRTKVLAFGVTNSGRGNLLSSAHSPPFALLRVEISRVIISISGLRILYWRKLARAFYSVVHRIEDFHFQVWRSSPLGEPVSSSIFNILPDTWSPMRSSRHRHRDQMPRCDFPSPGLYILMHESHHAYPPVKVRAVRNLNRDESVQVSRGGDGFLSGIAPWPVLFHKAYKSYSEASFGSVQDVKVNISTGQTSLTYREGFIFPSTIAN